MTAIDRLPARTTPRIATFLLLFAAAACDGSDPTSSPAPAPAAPAPMPVASVHLSADDPVVVEGWMRQVEMKLLAADGSVLAARPAVWESSDTSVAVVSASGPSTGQVVGRGAGTAVISAVVDGKVGRVSIEVEARRVASISLSQPVMSLGFMKSGLVGAVAAAQDGHYIPATFSWSSSDSSIVSVDAAGRMTARSAGSAFVTARVGAVWAQVLVTALGPEPAGNWRLVVRDLEDGQTRCSVDGVHLRLIRSGVVQVSGGTESWSAPVVSCDVIGSEGPFSSPAPPVGGAGGSLYRNSLSLWMNGWSLSGEFTAADRVEGTVSFSDDGDGGLGSMRSGRFVLVRG